MPSLPRLVTARAPVPQAHKVHSGSQVHSTWGVLVAALAIAGCHSPSRPSDERLVLDRWLECVECSQGELAAVLARGQSLFPPLRQVLLQGPDATKLSHLEDFLAQRALRIQDSVPLPPIHPPPQHGQLNAEAQAFVDTFLANYTALVERRAALAVAKIGGPEAKDVLQQAEALNLRSDVHNFIVYAHDSLWVP